jgi:transcriptional regulator with XRE-family HTH domain
MLAVRAKATGKSMNGKSLSQCYRYVRGEKSPSLEVLVDIAELFAVSPHYFLLPDGDGNDSPRETDEGASL